ncbi:MAG: polysaccharide biosynthesis C-terminal domain-containing protein [candidate division Zixibacteria bacterium]|nr:polysaccharide biosynthesis C-terminal domain-containing protein [candidate division Zixibacteria bacterium]
MVFLSKLLGLAREMVIADRFGTSAEYDLYLIAIILPALAYGVINFASFYLFVPYLTRKLENNTNVSEAVGWKSAWSLFNFTFTGALIVTLIIILGAPLIMRIWAGGYAPEQFAMIVFYSRVTAFIVVLGLSEAFLRAVLNVKKKFTYPAAGPIIFNFFSILCIILFSGKFSVGAIALGLLAGLFLQNIYLALRLAGLKILSGFNLSFKHIDVRELVTMAGLLLLVELLNRSYFMIDRYFAPQYGEGIISALNYSQVLVQLPDAVVGFAIASVLFPLFSKTYDKNNLFRFNALYQKAIIGGLLVAVPLAVLFFVNAGEIIHLIFYRGVFDAASLTKTAQVLKPYTPTIIALFVISTSLRACYGRGLVRQVLIFTVFLLVLKYLTTALMPLWFGFAGISAATSISQVGFALLLFLLIVKRHRMEAKGKFILSIIKIFTAGIIGFILVYYVNYFAENYLDVMSRTASVIKIGISSSAILLFYGLPVYLFGFGDYIKEILRLQKSKD